MIDLSTKYLGFKLNGPIVVSSTPLSESIDNCAAWKMQARRRSCLRRSSRSSWPLNHARSTRIFRAAPNLLPSRSVICPISTTTA